MKHLIYLIITLVFYSSTSVVSAQDLFSTAQDEVLPGAPIIANIDGRQSRSLNSTWNALIDPAVFSLGDRMGYVQRNHKARPGELVESGIENGLTLRVPGDWNTQEDKLFFYQGKVWYQRDLHVNKNADKRYYLYFGAVNYQARVYVNGKLACTHKGGYTSFNCEVTDLLQNGENLLVVKVDNRLTDADIPTSRTDWLNYGGITRDVRLVELPESFIENYKVQLDEPDKISGYVKINGDSVSSVVLQIEDLGIQEVIPVRDGEGSFSITAQPGLWTPDDPKLYSITLSTEEERIEDQVGFRTVAVRDGQLYLNGKKIFLRGISIHEEAIGSKGRASSYEEAVELLTKAKELNANFVRLAHYTHNVHMLRAADEMGLLVWAEIPVYWNLEFGNPEVLDMAKQRMTEMIRRDQNRASIIFWSLGNETPLSDARNRFFKDLNDHVKSLDDTRLTSAAMIFGGEEIQKMAKDYYFPTLKGQQFETWDIDIDDPLAKIVDVAAVNQYFGWYYSGFLASAVDMDPLKARQIMLDNIPKIRFHLPDQKPFIFSEFGAGAKRGIHAAEGEIKVFSEEYQAMVYEKQIEMIRHQKNLVGISPWILKDFRSPMRQLQGVQDYWNLKGLISDNGEPKEAFFILQKFYKSLEKK